MITTEGEVLVLTESFLDDFDDPLELSNAEQGPYVVVLDEAKDTVLEAVAVPDANGQPGDWSVNLNIPKMGLEKRVKMVAVFTFKTAEGDTVRARQPFFVDPAQEARDTDIVLVLGRDNVIEFSIPIEYRKPIPAVAGSTTTGPGKPAVPGDSIRCTLFANNVALYGDEGLLADDSGSGVVAEKHNNKTTIRCPAVVSGNNRLEPLALLVEYKSLTMTMPKTFVFKVWMVTPSVLMAASSLEDFINKARSKNVIPELEYTQADLVQYLHRGLALFNSFPPQLSSFTGMNMQGMILDGWLQCSAYYALCSQLQAEGQMAFDFSGQTVSLNVDRTPSIESALGRVESALNDRIKPMKALLAKNGATGGDGAVGGGNINNSSHLGTLGIMNAPTTRGFMRGNNGGTWMNSFFRG